MNRKRELLRLLFTTKLSINDACRAVGGCSRNTARRYKKISLKNGLTWELIQNMDDSDIDSIFMSKRYRLQKKVLPDWEYIHRELQHKYVTLQMLWEEYRMQNVENAYGYSQFTVLYNKYRNKLDVSMRQRHRAGECVFVDFAGTQVPYNDQDSYKELYAQIFVGVMGCSNYTFAIALRSQSKPDWIYAHNMLFQSLGGVPQIVVPDNLKSGVIKAGVSPLLNRTYLEMAKHYGIAILPTRVRKPQDKAKAEVGVLIVTRWILAKLRHRTFFSLDEINAAIAELLIKLNERPFKRLPGCRRSRFMEMDKPVLKPLPHEIFEYADWTANRKIGPDYHLCVDNHYYSIPHSLVGESVETRFTRNVVEFFHKGRRVANHPRSYVEGGHTTNQSHQPKSHQAYANLTPDNLIEWAKNIGPASLAAVEYQFDSRPHAVMGIRSCASLQRLAKEYGVNSFEAACKRAQRIGSLTIKSIKSILQRRLAEYPEDDLPVQINLPLHQNVRGASYYETRGDV